MNVAGRLAALKAWRARLDREEAKLRAETHRLADTQDMKALHTFRERLKRHQAAVARFTAAQNAFYQELGPVGSDGHDGQPDES
jgi:hypothetical protein